MSFLFLPFPRRVSFAVRLSANMECKTSPRRKIQFHFNTTRVVEAMRFNLKMSHHEFIGCGAFRGIIVGLGCWSWISRLKVSWSLTLQLETVSNFKFWLLLGKQLTEETWKSIEVIWLTSNFVLKFLVKYSVVWDFESHHWVGNSSQVNHEIKAKFQRLLTSLKGSLTLRKVSREIPALKIKRPFRSAVRLKLNWREHQTSPNLNLKLLLITCSQSPRCPGQASWNESLESHLEQSWPNKGKMRIYWQHKSLRP